MLDPDKAGVFGYGSLSRKAIDIADLGDDTSGIDLAYARDGCQGVGNDFKLLLDCLVQIFDLLLQRPHGRDGDGHNLVDGIVYCLG